MRINIKGRVKNLLVQMASNVECDGSDTIAHFFHGTTHGSLRLTQDELMRIVASNAPYDPAARRLFFEGLRAYADRVFPPRT